MRLDSVQLRWDYCEQVIGWLQGLSEWCETTTGDDFQNYNNHAIDELSTLASSMKWLRVHTCFNPTLDPPLYSDFAMLLRDFGRLLQRISNPINWGNLKYYRLQAILSIKILLLALIGAMRKQINPAETAAESDLADERGNMENVRDLWDHRYFRG